MKSFYRLTNEELHERPISPLLCGNFIELGYGIQTEPMWGEMLFNGSFEKFAPYHWINKDWYDLFKKDGNGETVYEKDWRKFDWYHSGYEHNAWFAAPNDVETCLIEDDSTFVVETTPYAAAAICQVEGGLHGSHFMRISNPGKAQGGMAQRGKQLKKDGQYLFSGHFRNAGETGVRITVALHKDGVFSDTLDAFTFTLAPAGNFEKFTHTFTGHYDGRGMLGVWVEDGVIDCDCFTLMPADTCRGWRPEVIEALREVAPKVIRWPGGCFASFYDWRDAIGPMEQRKPTESYFWGGFQNNNVGSMELGNFCDSLGAEQMICVNLFHPDKENYLKGDNPRFHFPNFTDLHKGAQLAADWVAYMNADESHPMGALRAAHGRPEPFGVRYWEIDNESCRWFTPEAYAEAVKVYSQAMKAVDPTICIGMITYAFGDGKGLDENDVFGSAIGRMLEIAGPHIDFFADRAVDPIEMHKKLTIMRRYNALHDTNIRYCNTEWLSDNLFIFGHDSFDWHIDEEPFHYKSLRFSKWRQVINIFRQLMTWQREGGDVLFVNFNNLANTHAQNVVDTPKEGVYISAAGRAMGLMASSPAAWTLRIEDYEPALMDDFQVQAAWDADRKSLILYVFNLKDERQEVTFDLQQLDRRFGKARIRALYAHDLWDMNTQSDPERIKRMEYETAAEHDGTAVTVQVPAYSFGMAILTE